MLKPRNEIIHNHVVVNFEKPMDIHLNFLLECNEDLEYGFVKWNKWRTKEQIKVPNLENADLSKVTLSRYNLHSANLKGANLSYSILLNCDFISANLDSANLIGSNCSFSVFTKASLINTNFESSSLVMTNFFESNSIGANFTKASLSQAILSGSNLTDSKFNGAKIVMSNLINCNLTRSQFEDCHLSGSNLTNSNLSKSIIRNTVIFGTSVWNINTEDSIQETLTITNDYDSSSLTVDDLEIASFIYLITNNKKITSAIDKISSKVVLILGRFTDERKEVLDYVKQILKNNNYVPVLFDFDKPENRDLTETVGLLGRMAKFIVADLTDPKSIPQELSELIPHNPSISIQPIIAKGNREYSMFEHWTRYDWVKEIFVYDDKRDLETLFAQKN